MKTGNWFHLEISGSKKKTTPKTTRRRMPRICESVLLSPDCRVLIQPQKKSSSFYGRSSLPYPGHRISTTPREYVGQRRANPKEGKKKTKSFLLFDFKVPI